MFLVVVYNAIYLKLDEGGIHNNISIPREISRTAMKTIISYAISTLDLLRGNNNFKLKLRYTI